MSTVIAASKPAMASLTRRVGVDARVGRCAIVSGGVRRRALLSGGISATKVAPSSSRAAPVTTRQRSSRGWHGDVGALGRTARGAASSSSRATIRSEASAAGADAGAVAASSGGDEGGNSGKKPAVIVGALVAAIVGAAGWVVTHNTAVGQATMAALAKSGFTAAFALIFVSELGDKTFFIAALLAMRLGRLTVLAGATSALGLMSVISVAIGKIFQQIPATVTTSVPVGEYLAIALLLFFGVRTLKEALDTPEATEEDESGELADAAEAVSKSEAANVGRVKGFLSAFWETFSLVFIAEWGDRSMLATIALGAAQNPLGVATGATVGHLLATLIAVVGGSLLSKRISERQVGITGGVLFIVFAFATLAGVF